MKKKKLTLFLATIMVIVMANLPTYASSGPFAGGDGTVENPYQIETQEQFQEIDNYPNKNYSLISDIVLDNEYQTICNDENNFTGSINGNNHKITNTYRTLIRNNYGNIYDLSVETDNYVNGAVLATYNFGTIKKCNIRGRLCLSNKEDCCCTCYNYLGSTRYYYIFIGGIVSFNNGLLTQCYSDVYIKEDVPKYSTYSDCYKPLFGAISGGNGGTISECYANLNYTNIASSPISGYNSGIVKNCYAKNVFRTLLGERANGGKVENCYVITTRTDPYDGFQVSNSDVDNYNIVSCYFSNTTTNTVYDKNGAILRGLRTLEQLKLQSTYSLWDFDNVWAISEGINEGYPYLRAFYNTTPELSEPTSLAITDSKCTDDSIKFISHVNINSNDTVDTFGTVFIPLHLFNTSASMAKVEYSAVENPIKSGDTFGATLNNIPDGYSDVFFVGKSYIKLDDNTVIWSKAKKVSIDEPTLRKVAE